MSDKFLKRSLLATTVIAGLAYASPAFAQEASTTQPNQPAEEPAVQSAPTDQTPATQENPADSPAQTTAEEGQAIVVTGTRIVSPNITSMAPVQVVGETEIDQSGALNIQEVLLENPAFGTPALSRTNSAFLTSGGGGATVDLRDLGSDRTLVLINNRRVVAGFPGSATVDLNVIPTQFVDRIDILTGGASSLYGSDAVAGVVNFIYKRNFSGLLAEAQYGLTHRGDSARYQVSLTGGGNFLDDRGNLMVHLGYTNEKGLLSRQRPNTRVDDIAYITYSYEPEDFTVSYEPFFSSFIPQGRFAVGPDVGPQNGTQRMTFSFDPVTGVLFPCFATNTVPDETAAGDPCVAVDGSGATPQNPFGFNRQFFRTLAVPVERYLFATRGTFEVTDAIELFVEGTYNKTSAQREIEPFALDSSDVIASGIIPIETARPDGAIVVNPFVPDAVADLATDLDNDGLRDMLFARRLSEVGTRNSDTTRDFFRIVTGLQGTIWDDRFTWDISYNYGQTSEAQRSNGQVNVQNFRQALNAFVDTTDLDQDGDTTEVVCADANARALGCVPINLFGIGSITPEALAFVNAEIQYRTNIRQNVIAANLSGAIIDLPAGPLGVAVGAEYRKEQSEEDWDSLTNQGLNAGNATPDTEGEFDVKEIYGELNVPILADRPFFHQLNLRLAGRISDYSTVGSVNTYSLGADWAPFEALRFRGTYAKAVRAPNIAELFTGPSQTFPPGIQDPCQGVTLASTGTLAEQCRADPGVLANINLNGAFTLVQADKQGISGFNSGNPNLGVETSKSTTIGAVFAPRDGMFGFLRNMVLSVDYYNILVEDAINAAPRAFILNQCYQEAVQTFCDLITRRPTATGSNSAGSLEFINAPQINSGELKVEGIDTVLQYRTSLDRFLNGWNMNARVAWTHILEGYNIPVPGSDVDPFKGEIGDAVDRVNGTIGFNTRRWGISFTGTYIGESFEDDQYIDRINSTRATLCGPPFNIASYCSSITKEDIAIDPEFYLDAQVNFTPTRAYELFLGVDNLLDNDAPVLLSGTTFNTTGADTAADVYDVFGRRYYAGVRLRF
jgi:iron complex outermembrane recepter protein